MTKAQILEELAKVVINGYGATGYSKGIQRQDLTKLYKLTNEVKEGM